jgi:hypothetical protein
MILCMISCPSWLAINFQLIFSEISIQAVVIGVGWRKKPLIPLYTNRARNHMVIRPQNRTRVDGPLVDSGRLAMLAVGHLPTSIYYLTIQSLNELHEVLLK